MSDFAPEEETKVKFKRFQKVYKLIEGENALQEIPQDFKDNIDKNCPAGYEVNVTLSALVEFIKVT